MDVVLVICSARHSEFCEFLCDSIVKTKSHEMAHKFLFVINEVGNEQDFYGKSDSYEIDSVSSASRRFIEKAKAIGDVQYNSIGGYEWGAIGYARTYLAETYNNVEQLLVMQCTYEILNPAFFTRAFGEHKDRVLGFNPVFQNFFCKYPFQALMNIQEWKESPTKLHSLEREGGHMDCIRKANPNIICHDNYLGRMRYRHEEKFGRKNFIEENGYTRKYKQTWKGELLPFAWK